MSNRFTYPAAAAAAVLALVTLGCPKTTSGPPAAPGQAGGGSRMRIAVIPKGTAHSYWQTVKAGADAAGREEGVDIAWDGPQQETDVTGQINVVQNQLSAGVAGVVLAACDSSALEKPVKDALAKNVPVVTIDSGLKDPISLCYIATDNVVGGSKAADALAKAIGEKGDIGVLPFLKGARSSDDREKGFMDEIRKYPNVHVVSTLYTQSDASKALDQTTNMMTAQPNIVGIFAANEPGGIGAANYLRQNKLAGKVKLVAYDGSDDEIKGLQDGTIQALIIQNPFQMGYLGVKTVLKAIRKQPIEKTYIDSGVSVATKENMNTPEIHKLLYPLG